MSSGGRLGVSDIGLRLPPELDFDEWERLGTKLGRLASAAAWNLADWALYGVENFSKRKGFTRYQKALELTGYSYGWIVMLASIARRFPIERRRRELPFAHHHAVASLPEHEQEFLLDRACELGWSSRRLGQAARATSRREDRRRVEVPAPRGTPKELGPSSPPSCGKQTGTIAITPSPAQAIRWAAAAAAVGRDVAGWLSQLADEACAASVEIAA